MLAEATTTLGDRAAKKRIVPDLSAWDRVGNFCNGRMAGEGPASGSATVHDDDSFCTGSVIAGLLVPRVRHVDFAIPTEKGAERTENTLEQGTIKCCLLKTGAAVHLRNTI